MLAGEYMMPNRTIQLGDGLEAAPFSNHPRKTMPEASRELFRESELDPMASWIRHHTWNVTEEYVYLMGNHEHRVERFCANSGLGPDIWDALSPIAWFEGMCTVVPYQADPMEASFRVADDLLAVHGWATGKNAPQKHLDRCTDFSIINGHTHIFGVNRQVMPSTRGLIDMSAMSPGCLRTLTPAWLGATPQPWSHGIGVIYHGARSWTPYMVQIFQGRCILPDGHKIEATQHDVERLQDMLGYPMPANTSEYEGAIAA